MRISIIGLGWLGIPLAKELQKHGFEVKGSATTAEKTHSLRKGGIDAYQFQLMPHPQGQAFKSLFQTDILFINIPPALRSRPETFHPEQVKYLKAMAQLHHIKRIIYISSTSLYPSEENTYTEETYLTKENTGNKALLEAERLLWEGKTYDLSVIRFGGLMGGSRIPGRYTAGKENADGLVPVNYIHQDDAVRLISWVIGEGQWNETYNGVSPEHPMRKEIYEKNALKFGFEPPLSYSDEGLQRIISGQKAVDAGFVFKFPNPLDFTYSDKSDQ